MKMRRLLIKSNILNLVGVAMVVYLVVVLAQTVVHNYDLQKRIDALNSQIVTLGDQRDELTYNLQFYQTGSFQEREARAKLGLQKPGESLIILAHPSDIVAQQTATKPKPPAKSNLAQWLDFLRGKS